MTDIRKLANTLLKQAKSLGFDYADIRTNLTNSTSFALHNNKFETPLISGENFGVGVRIIHKGKLGFYSTNDFSLCGDAVKLALKLAKANPSKNKVKLAPAKAIKDEYTVKAKRPVSEVSLDEKVKLAKELTKAAQRDLVRAVDIRYSDGFGDSIYMNTEGANIVSHGGRTVVLAGITAKKGARLEQTRDRYGGFGFEKYDNILPHFRQKAKLTTDLLQARLPKAGIFNAVMDPEAAGVFAHEAVGHACEADIVINGESVFKNMLGKTVGGDAVNITDAPALPDEWGSYKYDSEGTPSQYTKLVVNGKLNSYLHSRATAAEFDTKSTGNARAESYNHAPIVRMSNTYFEGGKYKLDELASEVKNGYLLIGFRGGQVNTLTGDFTFGCEAAREIKNGELGTLLKGCVFGGSILEILHNVFGCTAFNKKMGIGWCGKGGQSVPAGDGACNVGVKKLHIGGADA